MKKTYSNNPDNDEKPVLADRRSIKESTITKNKKVTIAESTRFFHIIKSSSK